MRIVLQNEAAQVAFGEALGHALERRGCVFLEGDLGAGKTTLSRGVLKAFGYTGAVKRPTYTLVEPYEFDAQRVHHFDLYRLADPEELEFIGARELLDPQALNLIEWPSRGEGWLPTADIVVRLSVLEEGRQAELEAHSEHGEATLVRLGRLWCNKEASA